MYKYVYFCITMQTLGAYSLSAIISGESLTSSDAVLQQGQNIVHSQLRNLVNKVCPLEHS